MGVRYGASVRFLVPVALAFALGGCGSFGAIGLPWQRAQAPAPVNPAAVPPVQSSALPPPTTSGQQQAAVTPGTTPGTTDNSATAPLAQPQLPADTSSAATGQIGRTDLLGGWTITAGGDSCQLFMTLTGWTGGYRASTRGCNNATLKSISAWNLQGKQVILAGAGGTPIAHLASAGSSRFDGQIDGQGTTISFYR